VLQKLHILEINQVNFFDAEAADFTAMHPASTASASTAAATTAATATASIAKIIVAVKAATVTIFIMTRHNLFYPLMKSLESQGLRVSESEWKRLMAFLLTQDFETLRLLDFYSFTIRYSHPGRLAQK